MELCDKVEQNTGRIIVLETNFQHLPEQMKTAVAQGMAQHSAKNGSANPMSLRMKSALVTVALTGGYSIIKLIDTAIEILKKVYAV